MIRSILAIAISSLVGTAPSIARADDVSGNQNEYGKVTRIRKGVREAGGTALGVLTYGKEGDTTTSQFSTNASLRVQRFIRDNVLVGIAGMYDYVDHGARNTSNQGGAALLGTVHLRLGLGAFLRPTLAVGVLGGNRSIPLTMTTVEQASQIAGLVRVGLPIGYFIGKRFVLEAGPQIVMTAGRYTPSNAEARSFTQVAGGFSLGFGYVF